MRRLLFMLLLLTLSFQTQAQKFILEPLFTDSVEAHAMVIKDGKWAEKDPEVTRMFPDGMVIEALSGDTAENWDWIFNFEGENWRVTAHDIRFSDDNAEGIINPLSEDAQARHSLMGRFCTSMWYFILIPVMILLTMIALAIGRHLDDGLNAIAIGIASVSMLVVSGLEIATVLIFGDESLWWCDPDNHGFFGSLLRLIPLAIVIAAQISSMSVFNKTLFGDRTDENGKSLHLSMKPLYWGLGLPIPIVICGAFALGIYYENVTEEMGYILLAIALGILSIGMIVAFCKNLKILKFKTAIFATLFSVIYIIGLLSAIYLTVYVIIKLIIQILIVIALAIGVLCAFNIHGSKKGGGGGGNSAQRYLAEDGSFHSSRSSAEAHSSSPGKVRDTHMD